MIPVTKPFMPPIEEYGHYLKGIWEREYLTNNGPLVQELEHRLKEYLDVPNLLYLSNGTIALQIAIKALGLKGEVITTPFSYVATTSSIVWEGCTPVFVDIDPKTLNIDPELIEEAVTDKTSGILATHVFGNPCDIDAIQDIADKHNLKVIYDAAHCFGTSYKGKSIYSYGDISTASFHATKLYHTVEGGAVITNDNELNDRIYKMRNFGHSGLERYDGVGINGKNSEFHAAIGLCNLKYVEKILRSRKKQVHTYKKNLEKTPFSTIIIQQPVKWNYSYFPIICENEQEALKIKSKLESINIYTRRYFFPSLETLNYVRSNKMSVSGEISKKVLCLPLYFGLSRVEQKLICDTIKLSLNYDHNRRWRVV